jgi:dolichol-phosphate mannosyltransferase
VIPVFRTAGAVSELVDRVHRALDASAADHLVLFVDDRSPDDAWSVLDAVCRQDRRVAAMRLQRNAGQHAALLAGIHACNAGWVAVMDGDLQDPPELLPSLLREAKAAGCTAFAERHGAYESWDRLLTSALYKSVLALLVGLPRRCGTFFVVPQEVVRRLMLLETPSPQVVVMARSASPAIRTVPFDRQRRERGRSAYNFRGRLAAAAAGLRCALACRFPLLRRKGARAPAAVPGEFIGEAWNP